MKKYYQKGLYKVCCFLSMMVLMLGVQVTAVAQTQVNSAANGKVVAAKNITALDGRQVQLSVSGQMPSKAKVQATPVQRTSPNGKQVFGAYDITIQNGNAEWQPQAGQPVMVSISDPNFTDGQMMDVYHEGANGNEFVATVAAQNGTITFPARSFSVYIVTEVGEGARLEVVFHQQNGGSTSIFVKAKDALNDETYETVLYDPGVGALVNTIQFRGWYTSETYTVANADDGMSIAEVRDLVEPMLANVTDGTKYHLYPLLFKIYHVTYYDELGTIISSKEVLYLPNDDQDYHACPINEAYMPSSSEQNFMGWQVLDGGENIQGHTSGMLYQNGTSININGDVKFKADVPFGHWLTFNENGKGASFTAAQFIENEQVTSAPSNPTRFGYTFGGWYTVQYADDETADPANAFTFGEELEANTPLYAKWIPNTTASYTIIIWKQNVHDAKNATDANKTYDFAESVSLTGTVGNVINAVTSSGTGDGSYAVVNSAAKQYGGFHLNRFDENVTIVTEGTSVLNVYYDRNLVTLTFQYRQNNSWQTQTTMSGLYGSTLSSNGYTWPDNRDWYDDYQTNWGTYSGNGTRTTFLDAFILADGSSSQTFYGFAHNGNVNIHFLKQNADGSGYTEANTVTAGGGTFYISNKYNGFKPVSYSTNGNSWTNLNTTPNSQGYYGQVSNYSALYIRFDRLTYNLLYNDGVYVDGNNNPVEGYESRGQLNEVTGIPFESSMTSYNKDGGNYYAPTFSGFAFEGWYIDDACTQPYTFTVMPEGLTVYAKWRQVQYRVFLHPNAVDPETNELDSTLQVGNQAMCFRVDFGEKVQDITLTRDDYTLMGWYSDAACTQVFNSSMVVLNDLSVTSNYDKTVDMTDPMNRWGLIVNDSIDPNTGNPITPYNSDITGWQHVVNGETVNDDRFWINKKLDLYAKWRSKLEGAKGIHIEYVFIKENQTDDLSDDETIVIFIKQEEDLFNNEVSTFSIAAPTSFEDMPNPSDSVFKHWVIQHWNSTTQKFEDSEVTVYPGSPFTISKNDAQKIVNEEYNPETNPNVDQYIYTIRVRAEYIPVEQATPSHIIWYRNYDADDQIIVRQDGTYNNVPGDEPHVVLAINEAVTIPVPEERAGFNFLGWMRYASGDDVTPSAATAPNFLWYNAETEKFYSNATMTTEATYVAADEEQPYHDLYAIWEAASYTVHFVKNAADATGTMEDQLFEFDQEQALTTNAFTYTDHCFQGWATSATSTTVAYTDGQSVSNLTDEPGAVVNLYAVWEEKVTPVFDDILQTEYCLNAEASTLPTSSKEIITEDATIPVVNGTWTDVTGATVNSVSTATAGTVTLTFVPEEDACAKPVEVEFTVNPLPTVTLTVPTTAQALCPNQGSYEVSANVTGGTAPYNYEWTGATAQANDNSKADVEQELESDCTPNGHTYTVSVVVTDANGCASAEAEGSFTVKMPANATITFTEVENEATVDCASEITAPETLPVATDACSNTLEPEDPEVSEIPTCGGEVTYTYTYTDCAGNTADWVYTYTINEPAAPTLTLEAAEATEAGDCKYEIPEVQYTVEASCEGEITSVTQNPEAGSYVAQTDEEQTIEITVSVEDGCGASATETTTVTIPAKPTVAITPSSTTACYGSNVQLSVPDNFESYLWSNGLSSATITAENLTETTTFTVTVTDANGCTATASQEVTVGEIGTVEITGDDEVCENGDVTLSVPESVSYMWSTQATTQSIKVSKMTATTTFYVTVTDASGCVSEGEKEVVVNTLPDVTIDKEESVAICDGETVTLTASGAETYVWNDEDATEGATLTVDAEGTYTVTGTDANGCENTASVTITVNPLPEVHINTEFPEICSGGTAQLSATGAESFAWTIPGEDQVVTDDYIEVENLTETTTFTVTGTGENGCTAEATATVTVNPLPVVTVEDVTVCDGVDAVLEAEAEDVSYQWYQGETMITGATAATYTAETGDTYKVVVTDENGCTAEATATVTVNPLPNVTATANPATIYYGGTSELSATGASTYSWNVTNTTVSPEQTTTYTVTGTDANGCENTATVTVTVQNAQVTFNLDTTKVYDGTVFVVTTADLQSHITGLVDGHVLASGTITSDDYVYGDYICAEGGFNAPVEGVAVKSDFRIEDQSGNDVTAHYTPAFHVTLHITQQPLTVTAASDSKQYDGTPLTNDQYTVTGLVDGDALVAQVTGSQTEVGTSNNLVGTVTITRGNRDVTESYDITKVNGTLTITSVDCQGVTYQDYYYPAVQIGTQCWLAENLRNTVYGPEETTAIADFAAYNNDEANMEKFGYLYTWYSAVGVEENNDAEVPETLEGTSLVQGICPEGWVVPSQTDFDILYQFTANEARRLRDMNPMYWIPGEQGVEPNYHFNSRAGGFYNSTSGQFERILLEDYYWTSTSDPNTTEVTSPMNAYYCNSINFKTSKKSDKRSVRCISQQTAYGAPTETEEGEGDGE